MTSPEKVLITAGHEVGGLTAFAEGLSEGFTALGIPSEARKPSSIEKPGKRGISHFADSVRNDEF